MMHGSSLDRPSSPDQANQRMHVHGLRVDSIHSLVIDGLWLKQWVADWLN